MLSLVLSCRLKLEFYVDCVGQFVSMIIWLGWQATLVALLGQVCVEYIHCLLNQLHDLHGDLFNWLSNSSLPKRKKLQPTKSAGPRSFIIKASFWLAVVDFLVSTGGPVESMALYMFPFFIVSCNN